MNVFQTSATAVALAAFLTAGTATAQGVVKTLSLDSGIDPAAAGALDPGAAALPSNLWQGADRAEVARLIVALPARVTSPTLADLARRVLAVASTPPRGAAISPTFAETRGAALLKSGQAALAARLLNGIPRSVRTEDSDLLFLHAALLTLDQSGACAISRKRGGRAKSIDFAKTAAFCEALARDRARAEFGAALVAERAPDDAAYFQLLDIATGAASEPGEAIAELKAPTPIHRAMIRAVGLPPPGLPEANEASHAVSAERMIAIDPAASLALRRDAAWQALKANAADVAATRQLFLAAGGDAEGNSTAATIASLFAKAAAASPGPVRAIAIARLLDAGAKAGAAAATAELARPMMVDLFALASGPDIASRITRGLLLAAEPRAANRWIVSLKAGRAVPGAPEAAARLTELLAVAEGSDEHPFTDAKANRWLGAINRAYPEDADERAALLAAVLSAVGLAVPSAIDGVAQTVIPNPPIPPLAVLPLQTAAAEGRVGETVLRAIQLVEVGEAGNQPFRMALAAAALSEVGLYDEARLLATEAAIAGGL
ncbi:MAG: hypothetical protein ACKVH0_04205 [Alphaproteobacteria bacterium]